MNFRYYIYGLETQKVFGTDSRNLAEEQAKAGEVVIDSDVGRLITWNGDCDDIKDFLA